MHPHIGTTFRRGDDNQWVEEGHKVRTSGISVCGRGWAKKVAFQIIFRTFHEFRNRIQKLLPVAINDNYFCITLPGTRQNKGAPCVRAVETASLVYLRINSVNAPPPYFRTLHPFTAFENCLKVAIV